VPRESLSFSNHRSAPDGPQENRRPPSQAIAEVSIQLIQHLFSRHETRLISFGQTPTKIHQFNNTTVMRLIEIMMQKTYSVWAVCRRNPLAIEQESYSAYLLPLPLAEGIHQLLQFCGTFDLEEDFVVAIRHFDVEVLARRLWGFCRWRRTAWRLIMIGHVG
jgi:hypothetical protein